MSSRWLRPEFCLLCAATGVAVGICGKQLIRDIRTYQQVRFVLENFDEEQYYVSYYKYVPGRAPEFTLTHKGFFADPERK